MKFDFEYTDGDIVISKERLDRLFNDTLDGLMILVENTIYKTIEELKYDLSEDRVDDMVDTIVADRLDISKFTLDKIMHGEYVIVD